MLGLEGIALSYALTLRGIVSNDCAAVISGALSRTLSLLRSARAHLEEHLSWREIEMRMTCGAKGREGEREREREKDKRDNPGV